MGKVLSKKNNAKVGEEPEEDEEEKKFTFEEYMKQKPNNKLVVDGKKIKIVENLLLKSIQENDFEEFKEQIMAIKNKENGRDYEWTISVCFWFAIHLKHYEITQYMVELETSIKRIVYYAMKSIEQEEQEEDSFKGEEIEQNNSDEDFKVPENGTHFNRDEKERNLSDSDEEWKDGGEGESDEEQQPEPKHKRTTLEAFETNGQPSERSARNSKRSQSRNKNENSKSNSKRSKIEDDVENQYENENKEKEAENDDVPEMRSDGSISIKGDRKIGSEQSSYNIRSNGYNFESLYTEQIDNTKINDMEDLERVRFYLQNGAPVIMGNILMLLTRAGEQLLACIVVKYYNIEIRDAQMNKIIRSKQYLLLKHIWKEEKNYIEIEDLEETKKFTYIDLIKEFKSLEQQTDDDVPSKKPRRLKDAEQYIQVLSKWVFECNDNFLQALLYYDYEHIALELMGIFYHDMTQELLMYCFEKGKEIFLSKSLELSAFNQIYFRDEKIVRKFLDLLQSGLQTNYYLNILTSIDISMWRTNQIKELIEVLETYKDENHEKNQLMLSYNPLMTIALACESLTQIAKNRKKLENQATRAKEDLLELGKTYSAQIDDEDYYEELITDTDFKGRSLLKIITDLEFEPLMDEMDSKAENIMMSIYQGKEATRCDGNIKGYSSIYHVITSRPKRVPVQKFTLLKFLKNSFEPNFDFDYSFQYRYRSHSINFIFIKEFICALFLLCIFQFINYEYLDLFNIDKLSGTEVEKRQKIEDNIDTYRGYNIIAFLFSFSLLGQCILKLIFNSCTRGRKLPLDKWTLIDAFSAVVYIVSIFVVSNLSASDFLDQSRKDYIDYFVLFVLIVSWIRFFSYFLVIRSISKLILTLVAMVIDTLAFILIFACLLIILSSVFTTLYQDDNASKYGSLTSSFQTLFDTSLASYDYNGMGSKATSHSILVIFVAFLANILLLNFVIAILSTTYENMKESGIFKFKTNLFKYCEKFLIAFRSEYSELILQPAPIAYLCFVLVPFTPSPCTMAKAGKIFSYVMHWLENVLFIILFVFFEIAISFVMYLKMFYMALYIPHGILYQILFICAWLFVGMFVELYFVFYDAWNLIIILSHHNGNQDKEKQHADNQEDEDMIINKVKIYNQIRSTMISLYKQVKENLEENAENGDSGDKGETTADKDYNKSVSNSKSNSKNHNKSATSFYITSKEEKDFMPDDNDKQNFDEFNFSLMAIINEFKALYYSKNKITSTPFGDRMREQMDRNGDGSNPVSRKNSIRKAKEALKSNSKKNFQMDNSSSNFGEEDEELYSISREYETLAKEFVSRFLINDEGSANTQVNLILFFNSVPYKIKPMTIKRLEFFNFSLFQESLIAYLNMEEVNAFEYNDEKNRVRVSLVKQQLSHQKKNLGDIKDALAVLEESVEIEARRVGKDLYDDHNNRPEDKKIYSNEPKF